MRVVAGLPGAVTGPCGPSKTLVHQLGRYHFLLQTPLWTPNPWEDPNGMLLPADPQAVCRAQQVAQGAEGLVMVTRTEQGSGRKDRGHRWGRGRARLRSERGEELGVAGEGSTHPQVRERGWFLELRAPYLNLEILVRLWHFSS